MPNIFLFHLARLLSFSGRENRKMFWPWVAVLTVLYGFIFAMVMLVAMAGALAAVSPDIAIETTMIPVFWFNTGLAGLVAILLASAVARRLHDSGKTALWGLLPVPFLTVAMIGFPLYMPSHLGPDPNLGIFGLLFLNNFIYIAVLIILVVLLTRPGTKGDNRFGPQPAATPIISLTQDI